MIDKLIRSFYYFLFFAAPLIMSKSTSELFEFNKIMFIYFTSSIIFFLWFLKSVNDRKITFKKTILDIPILIFLTSQFLSTVFSIDRYTSFFGYYGRFNGGLLSITTYIFLYYGFVNFFDLKKIETFLKVSLGSSLIVILWGLPGRFGYDLSCYLFVGQLNNNCWVNQFRPSERLFSTLGQPNWLGAYLLINFFIALYFLYKYLNKNNIKKQLFYFIYLIINFLVILFTRSRSSYLALVIGLFIFLLLFIKEKNFKQILLKKEIKYIYYLFISFIVFAFIFKTGIAKIDNIISFNKNVKTATIDKNNSDKNNISSGVTESFDIRKIVWKGAINLGLKYPLFGPGVETFAISYYFVRPIEHNLTSEWDYLYNKAHNEYLNYFGTTGFIGLLSYLFMIALVLYFGIRSIKCNEEKENKNLQIAIISSYSTILITNFFGFSTTTINLFFYIIPALFISNLVKENFEFVFNRKEYRLFKFSGWLVSIYFVFYLLFFYMAYLNYAKSIAYSNNEDYQNATIYLNNALKFHKSPVYLNSYSSNIIKLAQLAYLQKDEKMSNKLINMSLNSINEAIEHSSKNPIYWKNKSTIYYSIYQIKPDVKYLKNAISDLKKAQKLSPTDPKIPYNLAIYYLAMYDKENNIKYKNLSLKAIEDSIKLKNNFEDAIQLKQKLYNL